MRNDTEVQYIVFVESPCSVWGVELELLHSVHLSVAVLVVRLRVLIQTQEEPQVWLEVVWKG